MNFVYHLCIRLLSKQIKYLTDKLYRKNSFNSLPANQKLILKRNESLKDIHAGKRAFVIVNGPSLKNQDLSWLKNEITYTVSGFFKHPIVELWQPTYHCAIDPGIFEDKPNIHEFWKELRTKMPNSKLLVTLDYGYKYCKKYFMFKEEDAFFIALTGNPDIEIDITKTVQGFQSVSAFALANAIYMGCSPIYLLGFDHDYLAHRGLDHHFYDGCSIKGHKNEIVPTSELNTYLEEMKSMTILFENYYCLKEIAKNKNTSIYNATIGGYLDVFPRIIYEDLFNTKS